MMAPDGTELGVLMADPILALDTYRDIKALFTERKVGRPTEDAQYPLGPVLQCGKCLNQLNGSLVYPTTRKGRLAGPICDGWTQGQAEACAHPSCIKMAPTPYYRCANPHKALGISKPCRGVSINAHEAHAWVWASVEGWAAGSDAYQQARAAEAGLGSQRAALEAQVTKRQAWVSGAFVKLTNDLIDQATYDLVEAQQGGKIRALRAEIDTLAEAQAHPLPEAITWATLDSQAQCKLVAEGFVTPIKVAPSPGGPKAPSAKVRMPLVQRQAAAA